MSENKKLSIFERAKAAQAAMNAADKCYAKAIDRATREQQAEDRRDKRLRYRCHKIPSDRVCPCCGFEIEETSRWVVPSDGTLATCVSCQRRWRLGKPPKQVVWHACQIVGARTTGCLTQQEFADAIGITRRRVVVLESCELTNVRGAVAWKVAWSFIELKLDPPPFLWFITQIVSDTMQHDHDMVPWERITSGQDDSDTV